MMHAMYTRLLCLALIIATSGCSASRKDGQSEPTDVSIMTFNAQNLFDTQDDPGKDDKTYLPLAAKQNAAHRTACAEVSVMKWREECLELNWDEALLAAKFKALAGAILQVDNGRGPDILVLQEIENLRVLERLRTEFLGPAGYLPATLIEGQDLRGIDLAFLSRLPLDGDAILHPTKFKSASTKRAADTRGVLEATFVLPDGTLLTGFAVHFPAPYHPTDMRELAYKFLNKLRRRLPADRPAFAAGDFNTTSTEDDEHQLLERFVEPHWQLAHLSGCDDCKGSYYYARGKNWSFLDMILWSSSKQDRGETSWALKQGSARVPNQAPDQVWKNRSPYRFDPKSARGVSDHWPVLIRIETPAPTNS